MIEAPDETMAWIWEVKERMAKEIEGLSDEEISDYYSKLAKAEVVPGEAVGK
jgi:hypothetical protein